MKPATRKMLDAIEKFLLSKRNVDSGATRELWDVMTALRGPDRGGDASKEGCTIPVRRAAFPRIAKQCEFGGSATGALFSTTLFGAPVVGRTSVEEFAHFRFHARRAFQALEITPEVNL